MLVLLTEGAPQKKAAMTIEIPAAIVWTLTVLFAMEVVSRFWLLYEQRRLRKITEALKR